MGEDRVGLPDTSPRSMNSYEYWAAMCDGVQSKKVTPLLTPPRSSEADAWNAEVIELCSEGFIPRIYGLLESPEGLKEDEWRDVISRLKVTGQLLSETFSVVSISTTRVLLLYSSFKKTSGSPEGSPSTPTT